MTPSSQAKPSLASAGFLLAVVLALVGWALVRDEAGLEYEFFPLETGWQGEPLFSEVGMPHVNEVADLTGVASKAIFSVRWRGWLWIEERGTHGFAIWADDRGYLAVDGKRLLDTGGPPAERRKRATVELAKGLHPIEIGLAQKDRDVGLGIEWTPPGGEPKVLPAAVLYARRPVGLYRWLRRATAFLSALATRFLGAGLLLLAFLSARTAWHLGPPSKVRESGGRAIRRLLDRLAEQLQRPSSRRVLYAAFFLGLFALTWAAAIPWAVSTLGGDDSNYFIAAEAPRQTTYFLHRMVHVYLLKAFIGVFGGDDMFLGSRVYGAFLFAVTVTALAVAVRQLGPKLQLRTLAVTFFLLFSQTTVIGPLGAAFADYTVMMFVTLAVAVVLRGRRVEETGSSHEWQALALGVLSVAAAKSKVTGAIVFLLPALLLWTEGRIDLRRFARRIAYWAGGFAAALLVLMAADAIWLGDFWWTVRPEHLREGSEVFLREGASGVTRPERGWIDVIWPTGARGAARDLGHLWILALAAPLVAVVRRVPIERRLLAFLPAGYLLMLIVLYTRLQGAIFSSRMLIPILPAACFVAGSMFFDLGIERPDWRSLLAPRFLVPVYLAATAIWLVVTPYLAGELAPVDLAGRIGWEPAHFLQATWIPALLMVGFVVAALGSSRPRVRLALVLLVTVALLGVSFQASARALDHRTTAQRGELILYPWRVFEGEIRAAQPRRIQVSPDLLWRLHMLGGTYEWTAEFVFGREELEVVMGRAAPWDADLAIASRPAYTEWLREMPGLAATASFDPSGQLVLLRPREAARAEDTQESSE